jgi:hypothetical protein
MSGTRTVAGLAGWIAGVAVTTASIVGAVFAGVSIKVSTESVPPGGSAQMKVFVTEPKPISTGRGRAAYGGFSIQGIALISPADDALGVAVVHPNEMELSFVSPSATFGTDPDYPVLTVTGRVPASTPLGVTFPFDIDAGTLRLLDASGSVYPTEVKAGYMITARGVSISDVQPGSADLPAGSVVRILGTGFAPGTEIRFNETALSAVRFVDSSRIDVVLAAPARMHGMRIRARNPDGSRVTYFSYQRTRPSGASLHPVLKDVVPLFPRRSATGGTVRLSGASTGVALQNIQSAGASVVAELMGSNGTRLAAVGLSLASNRFVVREVSELFRMSYASSQSVRVRSNVPIQVMGVAVDSAGRATPLLPR